MRQIRGGVAVKCAAAPHEMPTGRPEAGQPPPIRLSVRLDAAGGDAVEPFGSRLVGCLSYEQVVYLLEIGRAEDARHLRRAVPCFLGNVLLLPRRIATK